MTKILRSFCTALVIAALVGVGYAQPVAERVCRIACQGDVVALE